MRQLRALRAPAYFVAAMVTLFPILDFFVTVWPLQGGNIRWRVAAVGQLAGGMMTVFLGLFIALMLAFLFDQPRLQRTLAALSGLLTALLLVLAVLFALDWAQLRRDVRPEVHLAFDVVSMQAEVKLLVELVGAALFTLGALRASREAAAATTKRAAGREAAASPLVAGVGTGR